RCPPPQAADRVRRSRTPPLTPGPTRRPPPRRSTPLEDCEPGARAGEPRPPRGRRARRGAAPARGPAADPRRAVADGGVLSLGVLRHGHHQRVRAATPQDRKSTRLNSSHVSISYAVFCLKKKKD